MINTFLAPQCALFSFAFNKIWRATGVSRVRKALDMGVPN